MVLGSRCYEGPGFRNTNSSTYTITYPVTDRPSSLNIRSIGTSLIPGNRTCSTATTTSAAAAATATTTTTTSAPMYYYYHHDHHHHHHHHHQDQHHFYYLRDTDEASSKLVSEDSAGRGSLASSLPPRGRELV